MTRSIRSTDKTLEQRKLQQNLVLFRSVDRGLTSGRLRNIRGVFRLWIRGAGQIDSLRQIFHGHRSLLGGRSGFWNVGYFRPGASFDRRNIRGQFATRDRFDSRCLGDGLCSFEKVFPAKLGLCVPVGLCEPWGTIKGQFVVFGLHELYRRFPLVDSCNGTIVSLSIGKFFVVAKLGRILTCAVGKYICNTQQESWKSNVVTRQQIIKLLWMNSMMTLQNCKRHNLSLNAISLCSNESWL